MRVEDIDLLLGLDDSGYSAAALGVAPLERAPQLALNSAGVLGGVGFPLDGPVTAGGITWTQEDGQPFASPIGAALAWETTRHAEGPDRG